MSNEKDERGRTEVFTNCIWQQRTGLLPDAYGNVSQEGKG